MCTMRDKKKKKNLVQKKGSNDFYVQLWVDAAMFYLDYQMVWQSLTGVVCKRGRGNEFRGGGVGTRSFRYVATIL